MKGQKNLDELSDQELLDQIILSNKNALLITFDRYSKDLYCYIKEILLTSIPDPQASEDAKTILINIFITLFDSRQTLNSSRFLMEYLYSSAYALALNHLHSQKQNEIHLFHQN
jgi:hypothetical protein